MMVNIGIFLMARASREPFLYFMDAIGLLNTVSQASYGSDHGYTIFTNQFSRWVGSSNEIAVYSQTYDLPISGVIGWFGTDGSTDLSSAISQASTSFSAMLKLSAGFFPTIGEVWTRANSSSGFTHSGSTPNSIRLEVSYSNPKTLRIHHYGTSGQYSVLLVFFSIFF